MLVWSEIFACNNLKLIEPDGELGVAIIYKYDIDVNNIRIRTEMDLELLVPDQSKFGNRDDKKRFRLLHLKFDWQLWVSNVRSANACWIWKQKPQNNSSHFPLLQYGRGKSKMRRMKMVITIFSHSNRLRSLFQSLKMNEI